MEKSIAVKVGEGSGVYIKNEKYEFDLIVTSKHCIKNIENLKVEIYIQETLKEIKVEEILHSDDPEIDAAVLLVKKIDGRECIPNVILDESVIQENYYSMLGFPTTLRTCEENRQLQKLSVKLNFKEYYKNNHEIEFEKSYINISKLEDIDIYSQGFSGSPIYIKDSEETILFKGLFYEVKSIGTKFNMGLILSANVIIDILIENKIEFSNKNEIILLKLETIIDEMLTKINTEAYIGSEKKRPLRKGLEKLRATLKENSDKLELIFKQISCNENLNLKKIGNECIASFIYYWLVPSMHECILNREKNSFIFQAKDYWFFNPAHYTSDQNLELVRLRVEEYLDNTDYIKNGNALIRFNTFSKDCSECYKNQELTIKSEVGHKILSTPTRVENNFMDLGNDFKLSFKCAGCLKNIEQIIEEGEEKWKTYY